MHHPEEEEAGDDQLAKELKPGTDAMKSVFNHNEFWKCHLSERPQFKEKDENPGEFWDKMAEHYESSAEYNADNNIRDFLQIDIRPGDTILDVGAGNGRLSVLMASKAAFVTGIDPSQEMLLRFEANMKKTGFKNYKMICSRWEDISVPKDIGIYDIVVCSFALGFYDLRAALEKMNRSAFRSVCLFWFAGTKHDDGLVPYIRELKGMETDETPPPYPDYQYMVNVLREMDICADVSIETYDWNYPFESPDEAVEQALHFKKIGPEDRDAAYNYYLDRLVEEDGTLVLKTQADQAFIKWDKDLD